MTALVCVRIHGNQDRAIDIVSGKRGRRLIINRVQKINKKLWQAYFDVICLLKNMMKKITIKSGFSIWYSKLKKIVYFR